MTDKRNNDFSVIGLSYSAAVDLIQAANKIPGVQAGEGIHRVNISVPIGDNDANARLAELVKQRGVTLHAATEVVDQREFLRDNSKFGPGGGWVSHPKQG